MNILIVSATYAEIRPFLSKYFPGLNEEGIFTTLPFKNINLHILVTGVGGIQASFYLTKLLSGNFRPELTLFCGIAGEISHGTKLGNVYLVIEEAFSDLGAFDEAGNYTDLWDLGLIDENTLPFINKKLIYPISDNYNFLPKVAGITSNTITSSVKELKRIKHYFPNSRLETMENAYFFYVAQQFNIPFLCIRSTSNYVGERNKTNWLLTTAINNLNLALEELIISITEMESL